MFYIFVVELSLAEGLVSSNPNSSISIQIGLPGSGTLKTGGFCMMLMNET